MERVMWREKRVFEHWTPIASLVAAEDYPLFYTLMKKYPNSLSGSWKSQAVTASEFLAEHVELRKKVLKELERGPRQASEFAERRETKKSDDGWSTQSPVALMLYHLHMSGEVMVVGHQGNQNVWGLSVDFLPSWVKREELSWDLFERSAAQRAIRALGTATRIEIKYYFVRGRYNRLRETLADLEEESVIHRVVTDAPGVKEPVYVHDKDVALLDSMSKVSWKPSARLISPFDNLNHGRRWTNRVFGFDYVHEQFLPKEKRKYGTYVLPVLWGDRLVGRIDPRMDKQAKRLIVNAVHAEPGAPKGGEVGVAIREEVERLAEFLGAGEATYTDRVPDEWKSSLR